MKQQDTIFENDYVLIKEYAIGNHIIKRVSFIPFGHLILVDQDEQKIGLLKESFDNSNSESGYFLPNVRLFSNINKYQDFLKDEKIEEIQQKVLQQFQINFPVDSIYFVQKTKTGSIIQFDNYYFWGEMSCKIDTDVLVWKSFDEIMNLCLDQNNCVFYENTTISVLLSFILNQKNKRGE